MSNTIDTKGDRETYRSIINKSIDEIIDDEVTYIGSYAFYNCYSLTTISFPSVTSIGYAAFSDCSSLTNISFPNVTYIGNYEFFN